MSNKPDTITWVDPVKLPAWHASRLPSRLPHLCHPWKILFSMELSDKQCHWDNLHLAKSGNCPWKTVPLKDVCNTPWKIKRCDDHPPLGDNDEVDGVGDGDHLLLGDSDGSERCGGSSFPDHCVAARHCQSWVPAVDSNGEVERSDYAWQFIFSPIGNKIGLTDHSKWVPVLNQGVAWPLTGNHLVCDFTFRHCRLPPTLPLNILDRPTA